MDDLFRVVQVETGCNNNSYVLHVRPQHSMAAQTWSRIPHFLRIFLPLAVQKSAGPIIRSRCSIHPVAQSSECRGLSDDV